MPSRPDFEQAAKKIRQSYLPWDEFSEFAAPGGVADQLQKAIADALERAYNDGLRDAAGGLFQFGRPPL